jgi:hypothetical protein
MSWYFALELITIVHGEMVKKNKKLFKKEMSSASKSENKSKMLNLFSLLEEVPPV